MPASTCDFKDKLNDNCDTSDAKKEGKRGYVSTANKTKQLLISIVFG